MPELILFAALYVVMLVAFRGLGGLGAAGGAIQEWGRRVTHV